MGAVAVRRFVLRIGTWSASSAVLFPREVKMFAIATAALIVLATTAEAATKYNYGGRGSYKPSYEHRVYGSEYKKYDHGHEAYAMRDYSHEPSYKGHYDDQYYSHEPSYESHYREPHHDSYDEGYGGDVYSENSMKSRQTYRHKRSVQDEIGARQGVKEEMILVSIDRVREGLFDRDRLREGLSNTDFKMCGTDICKNCGTDWQTCSNDDSDGGPIIDRDKDQEDLRACPRGYVHYLYKYWDLWWPAADVYANVCINRGSPLIEGILN